MLCTMNKFTTSCRDIKMTNKIRSKVSKYGFYIIDSSISNYDPSLSSDSE